jgi:hypothetical protein
MRLRSRIDLGVPLVACAGRAGWLVGRAWAAGAPRFRALVHTAAHPAPLSGRRSIAAAVSAVMAIAVAAVGLAVTAVLPGRAAARAPAPPAAAVPDGGPTTNQFLASLADPGASGLDPVLTAVVTQIGVAVVSADVTGQGRQAFPGYWPPGTYSPCCSSVTVEGVGARPSPATPGDVDVTVIWNAARSDGGPPLSGQQSIIHLHDAAGDWTPVPATALRPGAAPAPVAPGPAAPGGGVRCRCS